MNARSSSEKAVLLRYRRLAASVLLAAAMFASFAPAASAQLIAGANNDVISYGSQLIGNDVAYDPTNNVYLTVIAYGDLWGAFVDTSGRLIGSYFRIGYTNTNQPFAHYPRVIYSPALNSGQGGFLVAWHQWEGGPHYVYTDVVTYPGGPSATVHVISDGSQGGSNPNAGIGMAYSATSHQVLLAWTTFAWGIQGRFVDTTGAGTGPVTQFVDGGARDPSLAWNSATNEFGLGFAGFNNVAAWAGFGRVLSTGALAGTPNTFGFGKVSFNASVAINPTTKHYVMGWANGAGSSGAELDSTGALVGDVRLLSPRIGTPTSFSLAFNPKSETFLAVSEDNYTIEVAGIELDSTGVPKANAIGLSSGATLGSFVPRVTAKPSSKDWAISYSRNLKTLADQMVSTGSTGGGGGPLAVSLSADKAPPYAEGTTITWTATSSGGTPPIEYQFWEYTAGAGWTIGQVYGTANTFSWTPPAGTAAVQVWARNAGSSAAYDAYASSGTFQVNPPTAKITSFTADVAFPSPPNVTATWTAQASVVGGTVEYQFWRYKQGTGWSLVQNWSGTNTFTWVLSEGTYAIQVWARRVGSSATYEDWRSTGLFTVASTPARLSSLTANVPSFPVPPSTAITWTAVGSGGSGTLEYKFWLYDWTTATWSVLRDWGLSNQATWTPGITGTGWHALQAWVRTVGFAGSYEDYKATGFFNITDSTDLTLTANRSLSGLSESAHDSVTWTSQMLPAGNWEYEVWTWSNGAWTLQRAYATETTFTWYPAAGTHAVQIWGRAVGSSTKYERWASTGWFVVNP